MRVQSTRTTPERMAFAVLFLVFTFPAIVCAFVFALVTLLTATAAATEAPAPSDTNLAFVVEIGSRIYPEWSEEQRVRMNEFFYIGDSEYSGRIVRFVPDFRISDSGDILNYSAELNNPAVHIVVYKDTTASDSTWAFRNFAPHFSPRLFFSFKLKDIQGYTATTPEPSAAEKRKDEDDG